MEDKKDFIGWMGTKENIHYHAPKPPFHEREVWWAAIGENVGVEINGKGTKFSRPVIIFKKFSRYGAFVIPLTSQEHHSKYYAEFQFAGRKQYASLSQARILGVERLYRRMGRLSNLDYELVKNKLSELLFSDKPNKNTPNLKG